MVHQSAYIVTQIVGQFKVILTWDDNKDIPGVVLAEIYGTYSEFQPIDVSEQFAGVTVHVTA
jgi:hypothetical protein